MSQGNSVKDLDSLNEIPVFESIFGKIYSNIPLEQLEKCAKKNDCKLLVGKSQSNEFTVTTRDLHSLVQLNKELKQAAQALNSTEKQKKDKQISSEGVKARIYPLFIKMSKCEFHSFKYFGEKDDLPEYKKVVHLLEYKDGALQAGCPNEDYLVEALKRHYDKIRTLNTDFYAVPDTEKSKIPATVREIQKEFPEAFFYGEETKINITCNDYSQLQLLKNTLKIKLEGGQTNRRNRRFRSSEDATGNTEEKSEEVLKQSGRRNRRFESNETESDMTSSLYMSSDALEVKVKDEFTVKVYQGSITKLGVDCIVNAANDKLMHGGGVAFAIAEAAGYEFSRESAEYIRQNGPIPVGKCCVTSAGDLHYKYVIHTVGPRWHDYKSDDKKYCFDDLQEAVEVTFREAERLKMTSIAIPAISSGIFGVPRDKCVECYYQAVVAFLSSNKPTYLKEIHFVDRDPTMVDDIKAVFSQMRNYSPKKEDTLNPSYSTNSQQKQENLDVSKSSSIYRPPSNESEECVVFQIPNSFSVHLFTGNIVNTEAEAVVCPQDKNCSSKGGVARALMEAINDNTAYPPKKEKECRFGDVFVAECKSNSTRWKYILHTVAPRWDRESAADNQQYMKSLKKTYKSIFKAAEREQVSSIAMPILGVGVGGTYETPLETCSKIFATTVKSFSDENDSLSIQEIKLVFQSKAERFAYTDALKKVLDSDDFEVINLPKEQSYNVQSSSAEENTCCICMDTPSNPKALKCGHVFCKDCIDQQFKYKPACPSCGKVFGKMTGDQPPGTVSLRKERRRLPGYEDCDRCIVITYTIGGGRQGEEHPNPDQYFKGITRSGYLPNNTKGRQVAKLLNIAFSRKLVFTIGRSRTTGEEGVVTWNDIHHKTRPEGGPQRFGYPDDTYLDRVLEELAVKGVTPESADDPEEYREYSRCFF
ncbi:uncharacterized protein LOC134262490 [Saccostrea cucullata]|uniref:uncharacterized protein LOC134262490 n=1 Tax=Saccostrea cuccullata TaxID=36930 RepID=UPI002ED170BB